MVFPDMTQDGKAVYKKLCKKCNKYKMNKDFHSLGYYCKECRTNASLSNKFK
jgi:hypothetical protein